MGKMKSLHRVPVAVLTAFAMSGCAGDIPYRSKAFDPLPDANCEQLYNQYVDDRELDASDAASPCWQRTIEERKADYDLMFIEFDDQGWVEKSSDLARPNKDFLDSFFHQLELLRNEYAARGLQLVVFVHGWHHNAQANDPNVRAFRKLLSDFATIEGGKDKGEAGRRVIGIYVGWRGESVTIPIVNELTFWDRKNTADHVAQGSTRELFAKLDAFRDRANQEYTASGQSANVRMLTIAHSFGGLIAFKALSNEFLQAAVRHEKGDFSRQGDLVVIVNPAFEGSRYEPLKIAGQRLDKLNPKQLPVLIIATSEADWATGIAFPAARTVNAIFESSPGYEGKANTRTVGHNDRYTTHNLSTCDPSDKECQKPCDGAGLPVEKINEARRAHFDKESKHMSKYADEGFKTRPEYLCNGLKLAPTVQWYPPSNPFWVVETTKAIMKSHDDIFNPNMEAFVRQMYEAILRSAGKSARSRGQ